VGEGDLEGMKTEEEEFVGRELERNVLEETELREGE